MSVLAAVLASAERPLPTTVGRSAGPETLLLAHEPGLRRLVHRLLGWAGSAHDVEDLVQDTLLAAWRRRDSFRGDAALATWLGRIAIRKAQNHQRWAAVRRRCRGWFGAPVEEAAPAADCGAELGDELAAVRTAMARLRHADREVLVLHYLEARPIEGLCTLLSLSRAAADARLSRARKRLRRQLGLPADGEDA